ncbi:MAG: zinc transporter ZntB [Planctomycetota bacterium]|nr:zinc transporter ZntB [Planctomycetota bacterium]
MDAVADNLICAYRLDGNGGAHPIGWEEVHAWRPGGATIWAHLDRAGEETQRWVRQESGVPGIVATALLANASRPSSLRLGQGLMLNCRGVNLNPGADPQDMVWVQMWAEPGRIITTRHRVIMAIRDIRETLEQAEFDGPRDIGDMVVAIADRLLDRMGPALDALQEAIDVIDDGVTNAERVQRATQTELSRLRMRTIGLRRYLAPQREVFSRLPVQDLPLLDENHRSKLRELSDRLSRIVEDLDATQERASVVQDDIIQRLSERQERITLILTVIAAVFLPLGLVTGLWGINTGGIPGYEKAWGFGMILGVLTIITLVELWIFKKAGVL